MNELLPRIEELVAALVNISDVSLTGVSKTELIQADNEKTEYDLFEKKLLADLGARNVHLRKTRTRGRVRSRHPIIKLI